MRVKSSYGKRVESFLETTFHLEHAANVGPLLHLLLYYVGFLLLIIPGAVEFFPFRAVIWVGIVLLNYSLSIGVMHMHCHRPLFTKHSLNRVVELFLCFPSMLSATEMTVLHVHHHHRYNDGPKDVTTTIGFEGGWKAIWYWIRYGWVVKGFTIREIFKSSARPRWKEKRGEFIFDISLCMSVVIAIALIDFDIALYYYFIPIVISHITFGYFSWLTHAPARRKGKERESINNVNNALNFLIFNQGYHSIHHARPGIHWSDIPEELHYMESIDEANIVPYWVTIDSAWRIINPSRFRNPEFGRKWRSIMKEKVESNRFRNRWLPYFVWL